MAIPAPDVAASIDASDAPTADATALSELAAQTRVKLSSNRTTTPTLDCPASCGDRASRPSTVPRVVARTVPIHTVATSPGTTRAASAKCIESALDQIHWPTSVL